MPEWLIIVIVAALLLSGVVAWMRRSPDDDVVTPSGPAIDENTLIAQLDALGVDLEREQTPPPDLLTPLISETEELLDATRAKIEQRKALVVLLDDRIISVEATLGRMGAQARVIPLDSIDEIKQRTDLGGEVTVEADGQTHDFTHIPLRKFDRFVSTLRNSRSQ
ncbi:MAG: hypothetical protein ACQEVA_02695 [Myxococcota bacterium]